tara:strand:+ start:176 stop:535 length:360 start_codon:yes stop_codon:yes gene_type:complete
MAGTPFKMKGSPMQRNFGIGSPVKQNFKKEGKSKTDITSYQTDPTVKITPTESGPTVKDALIALHTSGGAGRITGVGKKSRKKVSKYIKKKSSELKKDIGKKVMNVRSKVKKILKTELP